MSDEAVLPKGKDSFKMNEVCKVAKVQPYMLRFWGTEFPQLEARKSGTGQRLYTRDQVELILEIRRLLFDEGLTIAGARKRIGAQLDPVAPPPAETAAVEEAPAPAKTSRRKAARRSSKAAPEVDNTGAERVQRLLSALREVRDEIADIVADLKHS